MANRLAEQYENRAVSREEAREFPYAYEPAFLTVNGWREPSRWRVKDKAYHDRGNEVNWTAVFVAGNQHVSVHVVEPLEAGPPEPEHAGE